MENIFVVVIKTALDNNFFVVQRVDSSTYHRLHTPVSYRIDRTYTCLVHVVEKEKVWHNPVNEFLCQSWGVSCFFWKKGHK